MLIRRRRWDQAAILASARQRDPAVMAYGYDATQGATGFYTFGTGTNVQSWTDQSGNGRHATNGTDTTRPNLTTAALNGVDMLTFTGANLDALSVTNALSFLRLATGLYIRFVLRPNLLSGTQVIHRINSGTTNVPLIVLQYLSDGTPRLTCRRVGGDQAKNIDCPRKFALDVGVVGSVRLNPITGAIRWRVNDYIDEMMLPSAWTNGYGAFEDADATEAPLIGRRSGGNTLTASIGHLGVFTGHYTERDDQTWFEERQAQFATPLRRVAFDAKPRITANRHYLSTGGVRDGIPISGRVIVGSDAMIKMRLLDAATKTTEAPGWGLTDMGSSVGGVWDFEIDGAPVGHWVAAARKSTDNATDEVVDTNVISVTPVIILFLGQSNIRKGFGGESRKSPYAASARAVPAAVSAIAITLADTDAIERGLFGRRFSHNVWTDVTSTLAYKANAVGTNEPQFGPTGQDVGGAGLAAFMQRYKDRNGYYPGALALSIGGGETDGIPSLAWLEGGSNDLFLQSVLGQANGPGSEYSHIVYGSGEGECNTGNLEVVNGFGASMQSILALHRARSGNASLKMLLQLLPRVTTAAVTDPVANAMLDQQLALLDDYPDDFVLFANPRHLSNVDNQHIIERGYGDWTYQQFEASLAQEMGVTASGGRGPRITSATLVAGERKATLNVTHDGGSGLVGCVGGGAASGTPDTAATGLSQFGREVWVDGVPQTITAAYLSAGKPVLEWSGGAPLTSGGTFGCKHQRGANPDTTMCVYDNLGWPMQPSRSSVAGNGGIQIFTVP